MTEVNALQDLQAQIHGCCDNLKTMGAASETAAPIGRSVMREKRSSLRAIIIAVSLALPATAFTACGVRADKATTPILLFTGTGTSPDDVVAIETVLASNHLDFSTISSSELNGMDKKGLLRYLLLIIPGGNFVDIGNSLTSTTIANVRYAVSNGLNYLGVCAGAFLAGNFPAPYKSLNLTSGVKFGFYASENRGIRKAAVSITVAGGRMLEQYWEDGPELTGWGAVVGKYPDGTPAIVEGTFGNGWVILTGVHAEAPESWRKGMTFNTPATEDNSYAGALIQAALNRTSLSHF